MQSLQDTFCGAIAGFCFRLFGHPFDTVKVRMQMHYKKKPFVLAAIKIFQREGIMAYYKGMLSPLLADIPANAVLFGIYEYIFRQITPHRNLNQPYIFEWLISGGIAGIGYALVVCPAEMTKCVLQMQKEYQQKQYNSLIHCLISIIKQGGIKSVFKGLTATIIRDIPQNAAFFATYEYSKYKLSNNGELQFLQAILCGALSGISCCLSSYPFDVIKTQLQVEAKELEINRKFKPKYFDGGFMECAKFIYKTNGLKGFWSGFESCFIYYIVGCTAQFMGYYYAQQLLFHKKEQEQAF